ncbi:MAG: 50S ribosomal protein L24 [Pseudomonadales bacterium]|jgi:large subunit ribosomal protein L24|nr:50S ribosomal protein L24 [Pseudomonadales bacterium]MCP5322132.1 50S ribosomal protein L24 [Pseudomonadales bacterium]
MAKIRRNDEVIVITGKDKGKRGRIVRVLDDDRVIVAGVNMVKRHTRANPQLGTAGGIVEKEASVHVSNVALANPTTGKADRVGYKVLADKTRVRVFRSSGELIDG